MEDSTVQKGFFGSLKRDLAYSQGVDGVLIEIAILSRSSPFNRRDEKWLETSTEIVGIVPFCVIRFL